MTQFFSIEKKCGRQRRKHAWVCFIVFKRYILFLKIKKIVG